ncbi:FAD-dependent monooxygenase [Bradyrhizobium sp. CCGUVB1N3]|uniref:FAD-dependent monooxygenase n=1 Tax=Bradyrhizobium sp. CCGUVB1N3 TaxID=2949629 RepID=UPI0020B451C4|nr:FAD-dependent monooxygenase [Bradyrhizobium sp. CCGUVB1N3]MCP3469044.1 FAD-dependent monooxygenase [Bradyrhizobium sp. CCGUVB1N3]
MKPVLIVGAGPVGLTAALALAFYRIPFLLFEEDGTLSSDTKAGTILTRTLEVFRRYGVADDVLSAALRVDEIGDIERASGKMRPSVETAVLAGDTRYPFVINLPQHHLEPILHRSVEARAPGATHLEHRLVEFTQNAHQVCATFDSPSGRKTFEGSYLLACDGGRSTIRSALNIAIEGETLDARTFLVDIRADLDVATPRDYPYLAYFADPAEWMILVRQPHCWRFLFPLATDAEEPSQHVIADKVRSFIGEVGDFEILNTITYRIHHRIASKWRAGRVFLMGDAAHLITPMWALGLNTGMLDAISLPWRLAWVMRGWADESLLDGYAHEQHPVAAKGSGEMAEAARRYMLGEQRNVKAMSGDRWANAMTRTMLGVRLDVEQTGDWSMVRIEWEPLHVGDRVPDAELHGPDGRPVRLHELIDDTFLCLHFTDPRPRPALPADRPGLRHLLVSRRDAPLDSGLRGRCLLDVGDALRKRLGCMADTIVLIRPDDHVAAILRMGEAIDTIYDRIVRPDAARNLPSATGVHP